MNKLIFYKRKKRIKIFFVPFRKKKELIKEIDLSSNNNDFIIDDIEQIIFEEVAKACGFDLENDCALQEFCKEFWGVDFFDIKEINPVANIYNLEVEADGFGRGGMMAIAIIKEITGGNK